MMQDDGATPLYHTDPTTTDLNDYTLADHVSDWSDGEFYDDNPLDNLLHMGAEAVRSGGPVYADRLFNMLADGEDEQAYRLAQEIEQNAAILHENNNLTLEETREYMDSFHTHLDALHEKHTGAVSVKRGNLDAEQLTDGYQVNPDGR